MVRHLAALLVGALVLVSTSRPVWANVTADDLGDKVTIISSHRVLRTPQGLKLDPPLGQDKKQQFVWEVTRRILSVTRGSIKYFVLYNQPTSAEDFAPAQIPPTSGGGLILAYNMHIVGDYTIGRFIGLAIHEHGHIEYDAVYATGVEEEGTGHCTYPDPDYDPQSGSTFLMRFNRKFWAQHCTDDNPKKPVYSPDEFVHPYSTTNVIEDLANTFAAMVICPKPPLSAPRNVKFQKFDFFWTHARSVYTRKVIRRVLGPGMIAAAHKTFPKVCVDPKKAS